VGQGLRELAGTTRNLGLHPLFGVFGAGRPKGALPQDFLTFKFRAKGWEKLASGASFQISPELLKSGNFSGKHGVSTSVDNSY